MITFKSLSESHFPLLLAWLKQPHVKAWWDAEVTWTPALIQEKYGTYVKGYKVENGEAKKIDAYIIYTDEVPSGYIQIYNAYDFARSAPLIGLPESLAAFDIFIGEKEYLGKGFGSQALQLFLETFYQHSYAYVFADPEIGNSGAIKAYEKAGFKKIRENGDIGDVWMLYACLDT